jgi:aldehyde dehydrogenase (NAD+)
MSLTIDLLNALGVPPGAHTRGTLHVHSPINGALIGSVNESSAQDTRVAVERARASFLEWRNVVKRSKSVTALGSYYGG